MNVFEVSVGRAKWDESRCKQILCYSKFAPASMLLLEMMTPLTQLPPEVLHIIAEYYRRLQQHHATATLQAALQRHLLTRCDDPRHTARTNTPGEGPVLCYQSCHNHPKRVFCRATRAEYFARILAKGR